MVILLRSLLVKTYRNALLALQHIAHCSEHLKAVRSQLVVQQFAELHITTYEQLFTFLINIQILKTL